MTEYRVVTECGRNFAWCAVDLEQLFRNLTDRAYRAVKVQLMSEYEAELAHKYGQEELVHELEKEIEGDAA